MNFENAVIMGSIYEPELDRRIVLMSVSPGDWERFERAVEDGEDSYA